MQEVNKKRFSNRRQQLRFEEVKMYTNLKKVLKKADELNMADRKSVV